MKKKIYIAINDFNFKKFEVSPSPLSSETSANSNLTLTQSDTIVVENEPNKKNPFVKVTIDLFLSL